VPELLKDPAIKQISWDDQWIGYDDEDTHKINIALANNRCMGGTMIWSVDFDSGAGSGDVPDGGANSTSGAGAGDNGGTGGGSGIVYLNPTIWTEQNPEVHCKPPCILVLPPIQLANPTTISLKPLTTSVLVRSILTAGGSTIETAMIQQTTISLEPVTTTELEVWAVTLFPQDTTAARLTAIPSIMPPSTIITLPGTQALVPITTPGPTSSTSTSSSTLLPIFFTSSHTVTIQPQPTVELTSTPTYPIIT